MFLIVLAYGWKYHDVRYAFEHSTNAIYHQFQKVLDLVVSLAEKIVFLNDPHFKTPYPLVLSHWGGAFSSAVSTVDGTHVSGIYGGLDQEYCRERSSHTSQNLRLAIDFNMYITRVFIGMPGSTHDGLVTNLDLGSYDHCLVRAVSSHTLIINKLYILDNTY